VELSLAVFTKPKSLKPPPAWIEHIPFAFWLMERIRPERFVELGTHSGNSYFAFCQAAQTLSPGTQCFAVDTWQGDEHAGEYGEEIYVEVVRNNDRHYGSFSRLIRATFDEALDSFDDNSIDLLHIDGLHTYEGVKHDFESWRPKLTRNAIVLFHDTNVRDRGFGVYRLWEELATRYPHFEFLHSNGLGVLAPGEDVPELMADLFGASASRQACADVREIFSSLGQTVTAEFLLAHDASIRAAEHARLAEITHHYSIAMARAEALQKEAENAQRALESKSAEVQAQTAELELAARESSELKKQHDAAAQRIAYAESALHKLRSELSDEFTQRYELTKKVRHSAKTIATLEKLHDSEGARIEELASKLKQQRARVRSPRWLARQLAASTVQRVRQIAGRKQSTSTDVTAAAIEPLSRERRADRPATPVVPQPDGSSFFQVAARHDLGRLTTTAANPGERAVADVDSAPMSLKSNLAAATVDVIIPVYGGFEETRRCIASVIASKPLNTSFGRLIIVDDCGPVPELRGLVAAIAAHETFVELIVNESNLGFVKSANKAMQASGSDVVLLNADTEVHGDWLDRLAYHAHAGDKTATVTPFSNNATICTFPAIGGLPHLPFGKSLAELDGAFAAANGARHVDIPTGVGFCMYISRAALAEFGMFEEAFGRGYGEETDFCQKALHAGWRNLLAGDVFVFHHGSVSFGASAASERMSGGAIMRERYPDYEPSVARWISKDPALPLRFNATAALIQADVRPVILHVLHPWGGGTEKQVAEIVADVETAQHLVLITRRVEHGLALSLLVREDANWRQFDFLVGRLVDAAPVLAPFGLTRLHVHHALEVMDDLPAFIEGLGIPYDLSIHDYALICPRTTLIREKGLYCGEPDEPGCLSCLRRDPHSRSRDIVWWRHRGVGILERAERVICPSVDVASRMRRYATEAHLLAVPHERLLYHPPRHFLLSRPRPGEKLRIATLGVLTEHKGALFLLECIERATLAGAPIDWTLIGFFSADLAKRAKGLSRVLRVTGPYDATQVGSLIDEVDPHVIFFPQHCVETYSYTLSEALASNRAILAPDIGAFPERVTDVDGCWLYDHRWSGFEVMELIEKLAAKVFRAGNPAGVPQARYQPDGTVLVDGTFYQQHYLAPLSQESGAP